MTTVSPDKAFLDIEQTVNALLTKATDTDNLEQHFIAAAKAHATNLIVLLRVCCDQEVTFDPALQPLQNQLDAVFESIHKRLAAPIDSDLSDDALEEVLLQRESSEAAVGDAVVAAVLMLTHLQRALT